MRLFAAIELSDAVRSALTGLQKSLGRSCEGVRWIPGEQLHLTVKFLGEVGEEKVAEVSGAIERAARSSASFSMTVRGCGCFPERGPVRIVWSGAEDQSGALAGCVKAVCGELEALGFPPEDRPFSPHITIGRVKEDRSRGGLRRSVEAGVLAAVEQRVDSVTLMSSTLSPKGPAYRAVSRAKLG